MSKEKGVNVQVLLRCRPFSEEELKSNAPQVVTCDEYKREVAVSQNIAGKQIDRIFTFDKVFGPSAKQKNLYDQAMVPIVNEVLEGFNCTIFAYGQTGTGKTFTMEGDCKRAKCGPNGELPAGAGVIPRAVKQIFDMLESQNAEYSVKVTFLELYNEEITDLLAPEEITKLVSDDKQKKQLPLMEDGKGGVLVRGLEEEIVTSANEIFTLLERGSAKRRTAETLLNKQSSRSHSLFSITIHIKEATPEGEELIKCGKLNLVDLAGSENISRSGAREGRAREAGEINKSLLTLGRVINALVEHLGHVPYRDSKLTRLLRDSLGGRTKTCIIATVSPAVLCLEETLSTLDYAHRAKNIRNKPEVNQKMMKSTLIKDLYAEIDRLKAEVYATREKNGVYIPKERYYQEEKEKKEMVDQIEQMTSLSDTNRKQLEELQDRYESQVQICSELSNKLESAEKNLLRTQKLLASCEEDLKRSRYSLKEKDFIISEQKKAENALTHQACVLRSELEKSVKDNAALFSKIDRKEMLSAENKSVITAFQEELAQKVDSLCNMVTTSISKQTEHLHIVEEQCHSFTDIHEKSVMDIKNKVATSRSLSASHMEAIQNVVRLHAANSNSSLGEISSCTSSSAQTIEKFLDREAQEMDTIFDGLQSNLSAQQEEVALFANKLQKRFRDSIQQTHQISDILLGFIHKLMKETQSLGDYATKVNDFQMNSLTGFQKAFEEQSKTSAQKLIDDVTNLLSDHVLRQNQLVGARINGLRDTAVGNKTFLDGHVSILEGTIADAKRKWQEYSEQSENDCNEGVAFSAAKHCRVEQLLQQCIDTAETARSQWTTTQTSVTRLNSKNVFDMASLVRKAIETNEEHNNEVDSARKAAEDDISRDSEELLRRVDGMSDQEQGCISEVLAVVQGHANTIQNLQENHSSQSTSIMETAQETFKNRYMDYEPSGTTPARSEPDIPSKATIESLRAMPMEALSEEFRENNSCLSVSAKEPRPSLIPRAPFHEIN